MNDIQEWFDTSEFPEDHPSGIPTGLNKKVPGLFKDECFGKQIVKTICLSAKQYRVIMDEANSGVGGTVLEKQMDGTMNDVIKKCKGVKSRIVKNKIMSTDYI